VQAQVWLIFGAKGRALRKASRDIFTPHGPEGMLQWLEKKGPSTDSPSSFAQVRELLTQHNNISC